MWTYSVRHIGREITTKAAFLSILACCNVAQAQSTFGTVLGTVKDPSGTVVATAAIRLTNKGTNAARSTLSSDVGSYEFSNVEVGSYELAVEAPGFQRLEFTVFDLGARETKRLDASLKVATQIQTVNVESSAGPMVQTDTSNIAETKTGRELVDLPVAIASRGTGSTSPITTLTTQPGVQVDSAGNTPWQERILHSSPYRLTG